MPKWPRASQLDTRLRQSLEPGSVLARLALALADGHELLARFLDDKRTVNGPHKLAGFKLHAAHLSKEAPILELIDGHLVTVSVSH